MMKIGLTGGIGSGKSTVARLFSDLGIDVIDADVIAREITEPGTDCFEAIANYFGEDVIANNGYLNRKKIKEIVFRDKTKKAWLEKLLHPAIRAEMKNQLNQVEGPYCVLVIPLLVEAKAHEMVDHILVVDADEKDQIARIRARDDLSEAEAKLIIQSQAKREERLGHANDVIINNGSIENLKSQVTALNQKYLALATK